MTKLEAKKLYAVKYASLSPETEQELIQILDGKVTSKEKQSMGPVQSVQVEDK